MSIRQAIATLAPSDPAYAAGDAIGTKFTLSRVFSTVAKEFGIELVTVVAMDDTNTKPVLTVNLFNKTFTGGNDNAAWSPSDADMLNFVGSVSIASADWISHSTASATATRPSLGILLVPGSTLDLYGQAVVASGAPDFPAGGKIQLRFLFREFTDSIL